MINRRFREIGVHPILAYLILIAAFIAVSILLFKKTEYAQYLYVFASLAFTSKLSETRRNEFLKIAFNKVEYSKVRIAENLIISIPFLLFLLSHEHFITGLLLLILSSLLALTNFNTSVNFTVPTPFSKNPFEFLVGFRNTFYLYPIAYIFTIISIVVDNFNLGIFSMMFMFLIYLTYYFKPEDEFFVWSYKLKPQKFLFTKIKTALCQASFFVLPIVLSLCFIYTENIQYVLLFLFIGYAFLIFMIVAKYAVYPNEIGMIQGILLVVCIYFPPLLVLSLPILYGQSLKRLKYLLG